MDYKQRTGQAHCPKTNLNIGITSGGRALRTIPAFLRDNTNGKTIIGVNGLMFYEFMEALTHCYPEPDGDEIYIIPLIAGDWQGSSKSLPVPFGYNHTQSQFSFRSLFNTTRYIDFLNIV